MDRQAEWSAGAMNITLVVEKSLFRSRQTNAEIGYLLLLRIPY
jgi:hypothetical protein